MLPDIVPRPLHIECRSGELTLKTNAPLICEPADRQTERIAEYLTGLLGDGPGLHPKLAEGRADDPPAGAIVLKLDPSAQLGDELGDEGYELTVGPESVTLLAARPAGLFYAAVTLGQLFPPPAGGPGTSGRTVPCLHIRDVPRWEYRGFMFDMGHRWFPIDVVRRYVDHLAAHKINKLHLHLTDDLGWRVESERYPRLHELSEDVKLDTGEPVGGYYTRDELRELADYAATRYVELIPEIDLPGHSTIAAAAYPELSCLGETIAPMDRMAVTTPHILCPSQERTYEFVSDVLGEVMDIFPSKYFHIGGDEAHPGHWERCPKCHQKMTELGLDDVKQLQPYFLQRVKGMLDAAGKTMIGWDEILEHGSELPGAVVQGWRTTYHGYQAAMDGHLVIFSPSIRLYLDYPRALTSLGELYNWEPAERHEPATIRDNILGVECPLWHEGPTSPAEIDQSAFPRLCALAELGWTAESLRCERDFRRRLRTHGGRMTATGIAWDDSRTGVEVGRWTPESVIAAGGTLEWDVTDAIDGAGIYEVCFTAERFAGAGFTGGIDIASASLLADGKEVARDEHTGQLGWLERDTRYRLKLPRRRAGATCTIRMEFATDFGPPYHLGTVRHVGVQTVDKMFGSAWLRRADADR